MQVYSPPSHVIKASGEYERKMPTTMKALRGRKQGLVSLVDCILANLSKAGGYRVEVRMKHGMGAETGKEAIGLGQRLISQLRNATGASILVHKVPAEAYAAFLKKELAAAIDATTFSGMRNSGPDRHVPAQVAAFKEKSLQWCKLVCNLGLRSGHFARRVGNGSSCQPNHFCWFCCFSWRAR
ncbi:unnamed protein product [Symbiodinium natans]|uniref:Uncharacterized protein n=1 Tax=Symbiodinium natans TaxID=878477 RepID=A0A812KPX5_9DINO|nr:unnamed protein product [Symbiodinium natans]